MAQIFEDFIMQCCKAGEPNLRKWIKKIAPRHGFTIMEDDYVSERAKNDKTLESVHNMLLVRGNPKICLVAHTDVCRDHDKNTFIYYGKDIANKPAKASMVQPVVKTVLLDEEGTEIPKRIIQDKECALQVGGDDRLGVAINLWIALNTLFDVALLFTTDEEIGLKSARKVEFPQLKEYDLCLQVDRGNHSDELVTKINSTHLCDYDMAARLLEIAWNMGSPRKLVSGAGTDVVAMKERGVINMAVNMTCGYHSSFSDNPSEYIDIEEAKKTLEYVSNIVRDFYLQE